MPPVYWRLHRVTTGVRYPNVEWNRTLLYQCTQSSTRTTRYGKGKRWQAVWTDDTGKETKRSFDYKDAAQAWLDSKTTDHTLNPHGLKADMLFKDFWAKWRQQQTHQRPSSLRMIDSAGRKRILPSFNEKYLTEIKREDVQVVINVWTVSGLAPSTARLYYTYMRQVFKEAVFQRIIRESPCVTISLPQVEARIFSSARRHLSS